MARLPAFAALILFLATPALLANPTITVTTVGNGGNYGGYGPYQTGVGGEFTLYSTDLSSIIANYYSGAKNQWTEAGAEPNFQTFCVEGDEYIYPNTTSDITFNGVSMYTGDTLTKGAAYLYSQFASGGNFGGNATYDYAGDPGRSVDAGELQDAIWALMGQEGQTVANNPGNPFLLAAIDKYGSFGAADTAAGGSGYTGGYDGVYIINLWNPSDPVPSPAGAQQDQLLWAPYGVPDGGSTLILLGIVLGGIGVYARRRSSPKP